MKTSYCHKLTQALQQAHCAVPERLLAITLIALWLQDVQTNPDEPLGAEWVDMAGIPLHWVPEATYAEA